MEAQYDPLLDPYNFADEAETSALTPQEIQSLKKKKHKTGRIYAFMGKNFSK